MTEQTAERPKKRRTFRKLAIVVIVFLLMPMSYVVTWLMVGRAIDRGQIPAKYVPHLAIAFRPLRAYAESDLYGSYALQRLYCKASWHEVSRLFSNNDDLTSNDYSIQCGTFSPFIKVSVYRELANEYGSPEQPAEQTCPFDHVANDVALSTRQVIEDGKPILMVIHYSDDPSWAFLCNTTRDEADVRFLRIGKAMKLDPTLRTIADLPPGCNAMRSAAGERWTIERSTELPSPPTEASPAADPE